LCGLGGFVSAVISSYQLYEWSESESWMMDDVF
jgi:hypothetical protein